MTADLHDAYYITLNKEPYIPPGNKEKIGGFFYGYRRTVDKRLCF